jgi:putative ABC transport system ATP-binding protein
MVAIQEVVRAFPGEDGRPISALAGVSLAVATGTSLAVTGPSGSGKSTLLHVVGGIERVDAGSVEVVGLEITGLGRRALAAHRRRVGFVFQRYHLLPALTALDNVIAPVLPYRTPFDPVARGRELLAAVGLAGREAALPSRLSGGQQQRVAIARALINDPAVLLADEPTGNLDSRTGESIVELLLSLETTLLLATHDPGVAARRERILRLRDGRVVGDLDVAAAARPAATRDRLRRYTS